MLNSSYAAIKQFQSQIFTINTLQELKSLLSGSNLAVSLQLISPTIWMLDWDIGQGGFSGTLELRLEPKLIVGEDVISMKATSFRLENPSPTSLASLEKHLIEMIKQAIEDIGFEC